MPEYTRVIKPKKEIDHFINNPTHTSNKSQTDKPSPPFPDHKTNLKDRVTES
ncbi:hypothetical protein [Methyloglobulus sp.]|uniref:hypothetical protein n=1 Tax=Methyloglobulus sp. TaxID=2518622 RepID=UPI0032B86218